MLKSEILFLMGMIKKYSNYKEDYEYYCLLIWKAKLEATKTTLYYLGKYNELFDVKGNLR